MAFILGGPKNYAKRRFKDLIVFFEWWNDEESNVGSGEPALFLSRANKFALSGNRGSACITLPQAHLYADSKSGGPTPRLLLFAAGACNELGLEPSKSNVRMIADAIVDNIPDLLRVPPAPETEAFTGAKPKPLGEVKLIVAGQTVHHGELH